MQCFRSSWLLRVKKEQRNQKTQRDLKCENANCGIWNKLKNRWSYPASRGFCLAWLLAFMKSFAGLFCRVVSLFAPPFSLGVKKNNRATDKPGERLRKRQSLKAMQKRKPLQAGYAEMRVLSWKLSHWNKFHDCTGLQSHFPCWFG